MSDEGARHVFDAVEDAIDPQALIRRIRALPQPCLLALDVDGTLAPIVDDPAAARVPTATRIALRRLAERGEVAFVTGRDLAGLRRVLGVVPRAWRVVEHGAWTIPPGQKAQRPPASTEDRARLERFAAFVRSTEGRLERKPRAAAMHVRGLDPSVQASLLARAAVRARELGLRVREGRAVVEAELAPGDVPTHKGEALAALHTRVATPSVFFAGDDLTDLPAIDYARTHGLGVFIASSERRAPDGVPSVASVQVLAQVLGWLADER